MKTNNKILLLSILVLLLIVTTSSQAQSHWEPVPFTLINPPVYSLLKVADTLFFGGSHVAKDSVGNFSVILGGYVKDRIFGIPFGVTVLGSFVGSLEYHQGFLYINGFNSHEQGPGIWKWREGEKEKMLNIEASDNVAMAIKGSSLYMVGRIGVIDTQSTKIGYYDIIQFHEKSLNKIRELKKHDIEAISIWGDSLYLGGQKRTETGWTVTVEKWNGQSWEWLNDTAQVNAYIVETRCVLANENGVYLGGEFDSINGVYTHNIARYFNDTWMPLDRGLDAPVTALEQVGEYLFVGGRFKTNGKVQLDNIAMWDGNQWNPLYGGGVNGPVYDLLYDGEYLWVAGDFTHAGGNLSPGLARYKISPVGVDEEPSPSNFSLSQNYPNPFNPSTTIAFEVPKSGMVTLKVYDVLGGEIMTLVNEMKEVGKHSISFDASNLPSGVYFYKLTSGDFVSTKKMVLVK